MSAELVNLDFLSEMEIVVLLFRFQNDLSTKGHKKFQLQKEKFIN